MDAVDIVILSRNRSWSLLQTVASVREFVRWPYRIIIRDHGSTPEHRAHIERLAGDDCDLMMVDEFLSCGEGRRQALPSVRSEFCVFLDDDCRVGMRWLSRLMEVMLSNPSAVAVPSNIVQDNHTIESGVRVLSGREMTRAPFLYLGRGDASLGGATLYRTESLRATEFRAEYNAGFEDWDQTLQMTRAGGEIHGSEAVVSHKHLPDSDAYNADRWRWSELLDAAIALYDRWGVVTGIRRTLQSMLQVRHKVSADQWDRIKECGL